MCLSRPRAYLFPRIYRSFTGASSRKAKGKAHAKKEIYLEMKKHAESRFGFKGDLGDSDDYVFEMPTRAPSKDENLFGIMEKKMLRAINMGVASGSKSILTPFKNGNQFVEFGMKMKVSTSTYKPI